MSFAPVAPLRRMLPLLALAGLSWACNDSKVQVYNTPPVISIIRPLAGTAFSPEEIIEVEAVAEDSQDAPEELSLYWTSSLDGDLGEGAPDANGEIYLALSELSAGTHALTLAVVDTDGESASESVGFEVGYGSGEGAPTVIFVGPSEGAEVPGSEPLTVVGTVTDEEQPWETVEVTLTSSRDGNLWLGNPASTGTVTIGDLLLSVGSHVLTLLAEDEDGNVGSASVNVEVLDDGRPAVAITSPATGSIFDLAEVISLQGTVSDDTTDTELLEVAWRSDRDGLLATGTPDSSGFTATGVVLSEGVHTVTLSALDGEGQEGSASIVLTVQDPLAVDDDHDGYSENDGDCDDADSSRYPGAPEYCDAVDNDCDGMINEDYWDSYEDNDESGTAYDLGDVDGSILWEGDSVTLAGVTLHSGDDEDWWQWDANDTLLIDNVDIDVRVTGLPSAGTYVLELWLDDGGWRLEDSDSGSGALSVSYTGDLLDDDEDDWATRFYASTWPAGSCSTAFEIDVES